MAIEIEHAIGEILRRLRQGLRRPAEDRRLPAHNQRRGGADAEPAAYRHRCAARQRRDRAIEPARADAAGPRKSAFQHVLAVEMRALAIWGGDRMHHGTLPGAIKPRKDRHRRIEREKDSSGIAG